MNNCCYSILGILYSKNATVEIANRIKKMVINCDYNSYLFPVIYLDVYLTVEEYEYINDNNTILKLSLKKYYIDNSGNLSFNYNYIFQNIEFSILSKENLYIQNNNNSQSKNMVLCRFVILSTADLNSNKENIYGNFLNTDLQRVLYHLVSKLNQNKNTVIEQPDNVKVYKQIILPFNTVFRQFSYLDTVYGIYNSGIKLFFDITKNYILNINNNKLNKNTYSIQIKNTEDFLNDTSVNSNTNKNIYVNSNAINYVKSSITRSEYIGNNNSYILNDNSKTILNNNNNNGNKTKVYYQKYSNPFIKNIINSENDELISIYIEDEDYEKFNFINNYTINDDKKLFNGNIFNILKYQHVLTLNKGNYFTIKTIMNLKKI